jgi:hypothetical protein
MQDELGPQELKDRLDVIEKMIVEGRRSTQRWGWTFVLWGIVYYVAFAWSVWHPSPWAWPVTIFIGLVATVLIASSKSAEQPKTTLGRSIASVWIALAISMCILFPVLGFSGRLDNHVFLSAVSAILGMANCASALILRWRVQLACAVLWWGTVIAACFGSDRQSMIAFLVAIFFCQVVFGIYGMIAESNARKWRPAVHA